MTKNNWGVGAVFGDHLKLDIIYEAAVDLPSVLGDPGLLLQPQLQEIVPLSRGRIVCPNFGHPAISSDTLP